MRGSGYHGPFCEKKQAVRVTRVSRVHDIGGQTGFGPVPVGENGTRPFAADWEARVYALAAVLRRRGVVNDDELRDAIERLPPEVYLGASYYERWLGALEMLVADKGVA
jgi:nitrile hydratase subunit beta